MVHCNGYITCGGGVGMLWYAVMGILPVVGMWVGCDGYITCGGGVGMLWYVVTGILPVVEVWVCCRRL